MHQSAEQTGNWWLKEQQLTFTEHLVCAWSCVRGGMPTFLSIPMKTLCSTENIKGYQVPTSHHRYKNPNRRLNWRILKLSVENIKRLLAQSRRKYSSYHLNIKKSSTRCATYGSIWFGSELLSVKNLSCHLCCGLQYLSELAIFCRSCGKFYSCFLVLASQASEMDLPGAVAVSVSEWSSCQDGKHNKEIMQNKNFGCSNTSQCKKISYELI